MNRKLIIPVVIVAAAAFMFSGSAKAGPTSHVAILTTNAPAYTFTPAITIGGNGGTVGWAFTVGSAANLTLDFLGLYDGENVTLDSAHPVALWDSSTNLLTEATIPAGVSTNYLSGYSYTSPTNSVTLTAGSTYYLGAYFPAGSGDMILVTGTNQQFDTNITFSNPRQTMFDPSQTNIAFPDISNSITGTYKEGWFGPTFRFTTTAVPEPSAYALFGLGALALVLVGRRKAS